MQTVARASLLERIKQQAETLQPELVGLRRHLHAHPELSFQEFETMAFVSRCLKSWGIDHETGVAETGIIATIQGALPGPFRALRADMDALPILEANHDKPYRSQKEGIMHACGHDVHTTCLLGAAQIIHSERKSLVGAVRLLFQPGEERLPGGASLMIKAGALQNPIPDCIVGQHVMPQLAVGKLGFRSGMYMASADEITMTVTGQGGHAAVPHHNIDTVAITCQIIVALQQVVSRYANPAIPSVLSFGRIDAPGTFNVIPEQVQVLGTFRTMNEAWRRDAHQRMKTMAESIAASMGAKCEFSINVGYPFLENDPEVTQRIRSLAVEFAGAENVVDLDLWMAAEDFAWYTREIPGSFYRLGVRNEAQGIIHSVHTPGFDIDESALKLGAGFMAWTVLGA